MCNNTEESSNRVLFWHCAVTRKFWYLIFHLFHIGLSCLTQSRNFSVKSVGGLRKSSRKYLPAYSNFQQSVANSEGVPAIFLALSVPTSNVFHHDELCSPNSRERLGSRMSSQNLGL
ncbi:hypothetical protein H5410_005685 [Solanum commersonii]|uniref:Uncharacterized protein n=1 Tax=Solanum commersonii TaxID=4109 RepID=A0A9J6A854_SOLCO|nr:hypothetical protein H5410_005685 [Solanum commersonii]